MEPLSSPCSPCLLLQGPTPRFHTNFLAGRAAPTPSLPSPLHTCAAGQVVARRLPRLGRGGAPGPLSAVPRVDGAAEAFSRGASPRAPLLLLFAPPSASSAAPPFSGNATWLGWAGSQSQPFIGIMRGEWCGGHPAPSGPALRMLAAAGRCPGRGRGSAAAPDRQRAGPWWVGVRAASLGFVDDGNPRGRWLLRVVLLSCQGGSAATCASARSSPGALSHCSAGARHRWLRALQQGEATA